MAPVTSDLVQIARKSIKTEPKEQTVSQRISQSPPLNGSNHSNTKQKEIKSILPPTTLKLPDKMIKEEVVSSSPPLHQKSNKIPLKLVNAHITCSICKGYLIDATTLVECLHSCEYRSIVLPYL